MFKKLKEETKIVKNMSFYWDIKDEICHNIVKEDFLKYNNEYSVMFIDKNEVQEFLYRYNFKTLAENFFKFNLYSVRSDISRIVQLFISGGFYADTHTKFLSSINNILFNAELTEYNEYSKIYSAKSKTNGLSIGFMYSEPRDGILIDILNCMNLRIQNLIDNNLIKAGTYAKALHMSCGNSMYSFFSIKAQYVDNKNGYIPIKNYFRLFENNHHIYRFYGNKKIFTPNNTRLGNLHWIQLANKVDLIDV